LKIDIAISQRKSSDFREILYTAADFKLDERHVIKNEKKLHWTDSEFDRTYFLFLCMSSVQQSLHLYKSDAINYYSSSSSS